MGFKRETTRGLLKSPMLRGHAVDLLIILIMLFVEIFVFNLPHWQTIFGPSPTNTAINLGPGLKKLSNNSARVLNKDDAWITVSSHKPINYLYINPSSGENGLDSVKSSISTRKGGERGFYKSNLEFDYSPKYDNTRYLHLGNKTEEVKFNFLVSNNDTIPINSFTANPRIPFKVSRIRLFCELFILLLIIAFRPGSVLYLKEISFKRLSCLLPIFFVISIQIFCVVMIWLLAGGADSVTGFGDLPWTGSKVDYDQYAQVADSLIHGRVYLNIPVNKDLLSMVNPYDAPARFDVALHSNDSNSILFDVAYKSGRYYSYFGVLPAILLFVPYKLLTGNNLSVGPAILIFALLIIVASVILIVQGSRLLMHRGHRISLGAFLLVESCFVLGLPLLMVVQQILFYQLPQTCGLLMLLIALSCWLECKILGLSKGWLAAGSFFMALTLACRPQFLVSLLIALVLFREEIRSLWDKGITNRKLFGQQVVTWASAILPFIIVFIPILEYNKLRFGSFVDFGATYNLTGFDMTNDNRPWSEMFSLTFLYFFQPPYLSTAFPFILHTSQAIPLWIPMQPSLGGMFATFAIFSFVIFIPTIWKIKLRKANALPFLSVTLFCALVIFVFDAHSVGYDVRYVLDFGWAIMLAFSLCIFGLDSMRLSESEPSLGKSARFAPLTVFGKTMLRFVVGGIVLAWVFSFFNMFQPNPAEHLEPAWWNVSSWFLFM